MLVTYKPKKNNSNTKNSTKREVVEYVRDPPQPKKKKSKKQKGIRNLSPMNAMSRDFACALKLPFHPSAVGCRVPDVYSAPTSTYHIRGNVVLGSNSGGTLGAIFLPNPVLSMIDSGLDVNAAASVQSGMTNLTVAAGASPYYGAVPLNNLAAAMSSYRVVSWGLKITNNMPLLSATGRIYVALVPAISNVPNLGAVQATIVNNGNTYASRAFTNVQFPVSTTLLDYPNATLIPISELTTGAVCLTPSPVNPVFYSFKSTYEYPYLNSTVIESNQVLNSPGGGVLGYLGGTSINNIDGGMSVVICADGLPASTQSVLDIEFVYHLEGSPTTLTNSQAGLTAASPLTHIGSTAVVERALQVAPSSQGISFLTEVEQLGALASKAYNAAKDFSQTPLGSTMASALMTLI
jgi:hypothetical protein